MLISATRSPVRARDSPTKVCPTIDQCPTRRSSGVMSAIAHGIQEQPVNPTLDVSRRGADASVVFYGGKTEKHLNEARNINEFAEVFTYAGCRHAFARHRGIHFDNDAARLANRRTAEFFQLYLA
jgi:Dienelactone hydrolase family